MQIVFTKDVNVFKAYNQDDLFNDIVVPFKAEAGMVIEVLETEWDSYANLTLTDGSVIVGVPYDSIKNIQVEQIKEAIEKHFGQTLLELGIQVFDEYGKLMVRVKPNKYIRERRRGRGIDLKRVVNAFCNNTGCEKRLEKRTIVGDFSG